MCEGLDEILNGGTGSVTRSGGPEPPDWFYASDERTPQGPRWYLTRPGCPVGSHGGKRRAMSPTEIAVRVSTPILALLLTWLIGYRLSAAWALRQKRKEFDLAGSERLYGAYGEFFIVWKLWNDQVRKIADADSFNKEKGELIARATALEANIEALLLRVAAERVISKEEIEDLGLLRQGFQSLRQHLMRSPEREEVGWHSSNHPQYLALKRSAVRLGRMLALQSDSSEPSVEASKHAVQQITHNRHEKRWHDLLTHGPLVTEHGEGD